MNDCRMKMDFGIMVEVLIYSNSGLFCVIKSNKLLKYPGVVLPGAQWILLRLLLRLLPMRYFYEKGLNKLPWCHSLKMVPLKWPNFTIIKSSM